MLPFSRFLLAVLGLAWSGTASAALDWCRLIPLLPSHNVSFAQSAAGMDTMGCAARPQDTAHTRAWNCTDVEPNDTIVILLHLVGQYGSEPNLLVVIGNNLRNLDRLRACSGKDYLVGREMGAFEASSIAVQDRLSITRGYLPQTVYFLRIAGPGYFVSYSPERHEGRDMIRVAEELIFDIQRPTYPTTRVEIAGQNLLTSPARQIIAALEERGARVTSRSTPSEIRTDVELSPPVGLEGVTKVTVHSLNQHVWQVEYTMAGLPDYMTYVRLLDERYGRSTVESGQASERRQCRDRYWESGNVSVLGTFCPAEGYVLTFLNNVIHDQVEAYRRHLRRPAATPEELRVDPDNL
jgi:hypothetical protein